jgi:hypothetical protein
MKKTILVLIAVAVVAVVWMRLSPRPTTHVVEATPAMPTGPVGPVPREFFGLHINRVSTPWPSVPFGSLRMLGNETTWRHLEGKGRNQYDWTPLDRWLSAAREHKVDVMYTFANTPQWAAAERPGACGRRDDTTDCSVPKDVSTNAACQGPLAGTTTTGCMYKEFVVSLMDHVCSGDAPNKKCQITAYSCWNEPNLDGFWHGTYAQSAQMCSDMVKIVKDRCQDCVTLTPDVSAATLGDTKANGDSRSYDEWFQHFLEAYKKFGNYPDAVAFHLYVARTYGLNPVPFPETYEGSDCPNGGQSDACPATIPERVAQFRSFADKGGMAGAPLWDTEGGWGTNQGLMDKDAQTAFVARWLILQASSGVSRAYWYMWEYAGEPRGWGGLWSERSGISPAGTAYGEVYSWLTGATFTKPCASEASGDGKSGKVWSCEISRPNGYQGLIVWDAARSYDHGDTGKYSVGSRFSNYRDLSGQKKPVQNATVAIGPKPILLESAGAASNQ